MDLKTAIRLVCDYSREELGEDLTDLKAVLDHTRNPATGCDHHDVNGAVDDPQVREAYHLVLDASDDDIAQALT